MRVLWCDTETTGLKTEDSGAFQIAMLYKNGPDPKKEWDRVFYLNPIDEERGILFHEDSAKIHGYSREQIESFETAYTQMPKLAEFFNEYCHGFSKEGAFEKLYFAGYNSKFDWEHLDALFARYTK